MKLALTSIEVTIQLINRETQRIWTEQGLMKLNCDSPFEIILQTRRAQPLVRASLIIFLLPLNWPRLVQIYWLPKSTNVSFVNHATLFIVRPVLTYIFCLSALQFSKADSN